MAFADMVNAMSLIVSVSLFGLREVGLRRGEDRTSGGMPSGPVRQMESAPLAGEALNPSFAAVETAKSEDRK